MAVFATAVLGLEEYELDNEIARTRRELARVEEERKRVGESVERDRAEFEEYRARTNERVDRIAAQTDSLRREVEKYAARADSLSAVVSATLARKRNYRLRQERLRRTLVALCEELLATAAMLPPMMEQSASSLAFLKSEVTADRIDNGEGMHRIDRILAEMEEGLKEIEIMQGSSPVPAIPGTVYRLRIGGVFEAVVDSEGRRCALWSRGGQERWRVVDDPAIGAAVLEAVTIREGKTLPGLVKLPYWPLSSPREGGER
jgi:hypothetical protein